jgi:hypothetical protein
VGSNSIVPRDNPRDSRYKFSLSPSFLNGNGIPGKDGVRKPSCFSDFPTFLPFVQHSLFRDWEKILSKINPFISRNSNMCSLHGHFVPVANIFIYTRTRMDGYVPRFFVIPLPLSSSYCRLRSSTSFSIWSMVMRIAASSAVKTLAGLPISEILFTAFFRSQNTLSVL